MNKQELEKILVVGAKVKIGAKYSKNTQFKAGEIITLIEGWFEDDNGLYSTDISCPSIFIESVNDYDSIYHLFGNDLEDFKDCEVLTANV